MENECYFTNELKKDSLKEPSLISKLFWIKPLSHYHLDAYRGLDPRDEYKPTKKDEWDFMVWNVPTMRRGICSDYYVDYMQCNAYVSSKYHIFGQSNKKVPKYCWKQIDNYHHCQEKYADEHPEFFLKGSKLGHH